MARPTDYSPEIVAKARDYLTNFEGHGDVVPTIAGLADTLGISRETIYDWSSQEEKAEFSDIVEAIRGKQERVLANKGLKGDFNPTIAKLMLTKHGYSDKQELAGPGGEPLNPPVIQIVRADAG